MLLAHRLWAATPARATATQARWRTALGATLDQLAIEFEAQWTGMTANERRVLAALAEGLSPLSREGRQVGLRQPSSAQKAIEALVRRGMLDRAGGGRPRIIDPLLALWVAGLRAA